MTKIRQEAAGSGTGTIALRAPVTNETRNLEYPDRSGTFALIDDTTGAPAMADGVPVVESGSNSDGEWTRWGDGTQECSGFVVIDNLINSGGLFKVWNFPRSFLDSSARVVHCPDQGLTSQAPGMGSLRRGNAFCASLSESSVSIRVGCIGSDSVSSGDLINTRAIARGRWK